MNGVTQSRVHHLSELWPLPAARLVVARSLPRGEAALLHTLLRLMDAHDAPRFWGASSAGGPAASVSTSCALFRLHGCPVVVYANTQALYHWPDEEPPTPPTAPGNELVGCRIQVVHPQTQAWEAAVVP